MSTALGLNATHKEIITALNQKSDNDTLWSMPIGAIYVQYKGQQDPTTLFGGTWEDISNEYAGCFFRASGGDAANFGEENQKGGAPNISGTYRGFPRCDEGTGCLYTPVTQASNTNITDQVTLSQSGQWLHMDASRSSTIYQSINEVRPLNSTILIWKRTA